MKIFAKLAEFWSGMNLVAQIQLVDSTTNTDCTCIPDTWQQVNSAE